MYIIVKRISQSSFFRSNHPFVRSCTEIPPPPPSAPLFVSMAVRQLTHDRTIPSTCPPLCPLCDDWEVHANSCDVSKPLGLPDQCFWLKFFSIEIPDIPPPPLKGGVIGKIREDGVVVQETFDIDFLIRVQNLINSASRHCVVIATQSMPPKKHFYGTVRLRADTPVPLHRCLHRPQPPIQGLILKKYWTGHMCK